MKFFTLSELCFSSDAQAHQILNQPMGQQEENLKSLINNLLDPLREQWGRPIYVNSGFRCEALNSLVGGVANSQHVRGEAADITAGNKVLNRQLFDLVVRLSEESAIVFDQLIDERSYAWLHISYSRGRNRGEILHL